MAHDVFISYSAEDKLTADAVCAALEANRIRCWIAPRDVLPGRDYAETLIEAIRSAPLMVLVFSSSSNSSRHVLREVERAASRNIPIIPFRIENVAPCASMEYYLSSTHWMDALTPPLERHLQQLADAVRVLLGRTEGPPWAADVAQPRPPESQPPPSEAPTAVYPRQGPIPVEAPGAARVSGPEPLPRTDRPAPSWYRRHTLPLAIGVGVIVALAVFFFLMALVVRPREEAAVTPTGGQPATTQATAGTTTATGGATASTELGPLVWKAKVGRGAAPEGPAVWNALLYVGGGDGLYALDTATGQQKWSHVTDAPVSTVPAIAPAEGRVIFGTRGVWVAADTTTGQQLWKFHASGQNFSVLDFCSVAVQNGLVYCPSDEGYLHFVDLMTGQPQWKIQVDASGLLSAPTVSEGTVYFACGDSLYAADALPGPEGWKSTKERWKFTPGGSGMVAPAVWADVVCAGGIDDGCLYAVDASSGLLKWKFRTGKEIPGAPAVSGGVVYCGSVDRYLYAIDARTGRELWKFEAGGAISSAPAIGEGMVYFSSDDGQVYAVR